MNYKDFYAQSIEHPVEFWKQQSKAIDWLLEDELNLPFYSDQRIRQKFALATLYYATNGDQWTQNGKFLGGGIFGTNASGQMMVSEGKHFHQQVKNLLLVGSTVGDRVEEHLLLGK